MKKSLDKKVNSEVVNVGLLPSFLLSSMPESNDLRFYIKIYKERKLLDGLSTPRKKT